MNKLAILQMSDTPQIESSAVMLRHAGYDVKVCGGQLSDALKRAGCDTVISVDQMISIGYDELDKSIPEASLDEMDKCDLFVEIKVRNVPRILKRWPRLEKRIAWWRVNGAQPEICPKGGDEINLPCPIITACLWYGLPLYYQDETTKPFGQSFMKPNHLVSLQEWRDLAAKAKTGMNGMAYTFWPPYPRSKEYDIIDRSSLTEYGDPFCVCHNVGAWGYGPIIDRCVKRLRVSMYGRGSPLGKIQHSEIPDIASRGLALVHLKSVDCPGWALYEALLAGCPVITGRLLNSRMLAYELLEHKKTCLEFGEPAALEYGRGPVYTDLCFAHIKQHLEHLKDPIINAAIGESGRIRLNKLMWRANRDGDSFKEFMERWFPK